MKSAVLIPFLAVSVSLSFLASAHDVRHHDAHVHGQATLDVAADGPWVEVALAAPGIGILDFERPPAAAAEHAALASALQLLRNGSWLRLPAAAGCRIEQMTATAEGFEAPAPAAADAVAHHHHAGFAVSGRYRCATPSALRSLDVTLPARFAGLHQVIVNTASSGGQGRAVVTADAPRVELAP